MQLLFFIWCVLWAIETIHFSTLYFKYSNRDLSTVFKNKKYLVVYTVNFLYLIFLSIYFILIKDKMQNYFITAMVANIIVNTYNLCLMVSKKYTVHSIFASVFYRYILVIFTVIYIFGVAPTESVTKNIVTDVIQEIELDVVVGGKYYGQINPLDDENKFLFIYNSKKSNEVKFETLILEKRNVVFHPNFNKKPKLTLSQKTYYKENIWGKEIVSLSPVIYNIYIQNESQILDYSKLK